MNGLEAIELMKQGKMVISREDSYSYIVFKIIDNNVYYKYLLDDSGFEVDDCFDFGSTYEEYIEPKTLTGWERVSVGECYFNLRPNASVTREYGCKGDNVEFENANYFSTKDKAEEINFKQTLFRKLQRFSDENGGSKVDWKDSGQRKFYIYRGHDCEELFIHSALYGQDFGQVYFVSREVAEEAIELFCDDLIKYFTHDWSKGGHE